MICFHLKRFFFVSKNNKQSQKKQGVNRGKKPWINTEQSSPFPKVNNSKKSFTWVFLFKHAKS